ncbi:hypothetical protein QYE76_043448 [Lolium multiflorum]|uniref:Transcription factor MYC/MYB N-terminal domain-containing protein n=1 Tax=Lolium multiflorum TaxID=4521 RepID=A0AAD8TH90_LOLMU|nr:hypothetical protein QYE76_043448 [Lolium multiflorum]
MHYPPVSSPAFLLPACFPIHSPIFLPPPMNLWTYGNASMMEAFMASADLPSFPWGAAATPSPPAAVSLPLPHPQQQPAFSNDKLQQRLQAIIEGSRYTWTYAIFW